MRVRSLLPRGILAATVAAALGAVSPAAADVVQGTRFETAERGHTVDVRLDRGHATLVVTRVVENPGPRSDQAVFWLDMPEGAVATRLRTAGEGRGGEVWFEGELLEAEEAARRYKELTGIGGYYPKDPALLSWRSQGQLALQVFPVPPRGTKKVEYTLRMPLAYEGGVYKLTLPSLGTEALRATVRVSAAHPEDAVTVNGVPLAAGAPVQASRDLEIVLGPRGVARVDGAIASFGFAEDRHLVHARLAAAPRLSEVPANASVVILVDTSHSMGDTLEASLGAARAYVAHFPGAQVDVVTFDRKARSVFGGPLPAREALARLAGFQPATANGSNLDAALAFADAKLARSPSQARRIVLLTDLRTRDALNAEAFAAKKLASGAVLHVATVKVGEASLARDDDDAWAAAPRATGGLLWRASSRETNGQAEANVFEEWVRPRQLDRLKVAGLPPDGAIDTTTELHEGAGVEVTTIAARGVTKVTLEGELWSRRVSFAFTPTEAEGKRWSALVFGTSLLSSLSEKEQMTLAMNGRAVSPVTSYLAIEPGVRPSTDGLEETGFGSGGGGVGSGFGSAHGGATCRVGASFDAPAYFEREFASALDACGATAGNATAETTLDEIVDVREVILEPRDAKAEACVGERLWALRLPSGFDDAHRTFSLSSRR